MASRADEKGDPGKLTEQEVNALIFELRANLTDIQDGKEEYLNKDVAQVLTRQEFFHPLPEELKRLWDLCLIWHRFYLHGCPYDRDRTASELC